MSEPHRRDPAVVTARLREADMVARFIAVGEVVFGDAPGHAQALMRGSERPPIWTNFARPSWSASKNWR